MGEREDVPNFRGKEHAEGFGTKLLSVVAIVITIGSVVVTVTWQAGKFAEKDEIKLLDGRIWLLQLDSNHNNEELKHLRELYNKQESNGCNPNVVQRRESRR